ncbi:MULTISPECIES: ribosome hibernation-promoting factor, HPF/YfiA family [Prauserella salsuginis group]|uniref:Ribosome hibernation promoting factor n=2 Tax=Prauserella salsuginis group TaxID=2893672 RepID=A0A839XIZ2_9PSEU|nr:MULTISPECIES: ribosome-associated translation inhibitor RaiA [Prauserella salsuginis group]MBB3663912.1 ribosomal subunit interface protein [Prauserella sediminis]MCR3721369.1 ribosomal subunit interface protein [Prauserella flava]MCR3732360.1 ribosomal subunit interface protein [Prauserella salsuginis]
MDIVVKGRNVEVPEHYRQHVSEKLDRLERYDRKVIRYEVELFHERNRRQSKNCQRVEITGRGKGPAMRAEASAGDFYAALDAAVSKLENRMRRAHDRRKVHYGRRVPESVAEATAGGADGRSGGATTAVMEAPMETEDMNGAVMSSAADTVSADGAIRLPSQRLDDGFDDLAIDDRGDIGDDHEPGRIVREKQHSAKPITVDEALSEMELVGHDFYLFNDADAGKPSVVYRRKGFDYGVIRLG